MDVMYFVAMAVGGAVGAFLYGVVHDYGLNRRIKALEARLDSQENLVRGAKGNEAQRESKEQLSAAIGDGLAALKSGKEPKEILAELAVKYPSAVTALPALLKRFGIK